MKAKQDSSRTVLLPAVTGCPYPVWLLRREKDEPKVRIATTTEPEWQEADAAYFVIDPTLRRVAGRRVPMGYGFALYLWSEYNRPLINEYWNGAVSDDDAVRRCTKVDVPPPRTFSPEPTATETAAREPAR